MLKNADLQNQFAIRQFAGTVASYDDIFGDYSKAIYVVSMRGDSVPWSRPAGDQYTWCACLILNTFPGGTNPFLADLHLFAFVYGQNEIYSEHILDGTESGWLPALIVYGVAM